MPTYTHTSHEIEVAVTPQYQPSASKPLRHTYVHSYTVVITNRSSHAVQLLRRHWIIYNGTNQYREVKGDGVIGQQPVIEPGESYTYQSWSPINTAIGRMEGTYHMVRLADDLPLDVKVPTFYLYYDNVLN